RPRVQPACAWAPVRPACARVLTSRPWAHPAENPLPPGTSGPVAHRPRGAVLSSPRRNAAVVRPHAAQARRAVAAVEFAIVAPLLFGLLLGVWEIGRLVQVQQIISTAAREGGRVAA